MTEKNLIKIYVNATSENDWKHRNEIYDRI